MERPAQKDCTEKDDRVVECEVHLPSSFLKACKILFLVSLRCTWKRLGSSAALPSRHRSKNSRLPKAAQSRRRCLSILHCRCSLDVSRALTLPLTWQWSRSASGAGSSVRSVKKRAATKQGWLSHQKMYLIVWWRHRKGPPLQWCPDKRSPSR